MKVFSLTGQRFGRLLVLGRSARRGKERQVYWMCQCDCGSVKPILSLSLRTGKSKSCGCMCQVRHGQHKTPEYRAWSAMIQRCTNPKNPGWKNYGGRGISVCFEWRKFESFIRDMGRRPEGRSIDRIDVNGNYEPANCRWADWSTQMRNRRPQQRKMATGGRRDV